MMGEIVKKMKEIVLYAFLLSLLLDCGPSYNTFDIEKFSPRDCHTDAIVYSFHKKYPVPKVLIIYIQMI